MCAELLRKEDVRANEYPRRYLKMWHIQEISGAPAQNVWVMLDETKYGLPFPEGYDGEQKHGFCFYSLELDEMGCLR